MDNFLLNESTDESDEEFEKRIVTFRPFVRYDGAKEFQRCFRLSKRLVEGLLKIIGPSIKSTAVTSRALSPEEKLLLFLRFSATNQFYHEVQDTQGKM